MTCLRILLGSLVLLGIPAFVFCGECCKAHYDILFKYNDEKWCSNYCCFQIGKYDCCDNSLLQAPSSERDDFCADYFHSNTCYCGQFRDAADSESRQHDAATAGVSREPSPELPGLDGSFLSK
uniref:Uncharacterized protein n=1 Tax=Magallana gigas TaxID=29159 RepID=A0A8W8HLB8_MAGGI